MPELRTVTVRRVPFLQQPGETPTEPAGPVLGGDVLLVDPAERAVVGFQVILGRHAGPFDLMWKALSQTAWTDASQGGPRGGGRLSGIYAPHACFGWLPPVTVRHRYGAQAAHLDHAQPSLVRAFRHLGEDAWALTARLMPKSAARHADAVQAIPPAWRFAGMWTSGIINRDNALPYHRDAGNLNGCLSAMLALRQGVRGGALHLADYDTWLAIPDRSLTVFAGQTVLHGVSPLERSLTGHRYTAVWYVKSALRNCAPDYETEVARAQLMATTHDQAPA